MLWESGSCRTPQAGAPPAGTIPRLGIFERFRNPDSSDDLAAAVSSLGLPESPLRFLSDALGVPRAGVLTTPVLWEFR